MLPFNVCTSGVVVVVVQHNGCHCSRQTILANMHALLGSTAASRARGIRELLTEVVARRSIGKKYEYSLSEDAIVVFKLGPPNDEQTQRRQTTRSDMNMKRCGNNEREREMSVKKTAARVT